MPWPNGSANSPITTDWPGSSSSPPGIRSLQIHLDPDVADPRSPGQPAARPRLRAALDQGPAVPQPDGAPAAVLGRPGHPGGDPAIHGRRPRRRPWCPWNIEFIRRINGLASVEDVYRTVFDAEYLVMGLGDVYLGAPVATPLDPRHRLVTTKYNPARTWTAENSVGIGGAYLCIYGMEGPPGGYQFVGRTTQVWSTHQQRGAFEPGCRGCCASSTGSSGSQSAPRNWPKCAPTWPPAGWS